MPTIGPIVVSTGAAASDRRLFGELKAELARGYNADDETTLAIAGDAINAAIRVYNRFNWPWEILTHQLTLSTNVDTYALPQPFKAPLALHLLSSSRKNKKLAYFPYESFVAEYDLKQDGEPRYYTLKNTHETGLVTVWPRPQSAYTAEIDYYRRTPIMRSDSHPLDVPQEAEEGILSWAWYEFVKRIGGEFGASRIGAALSEARMARSELVYMVSERGDPVGVV